MKSLLKIKSLIFFCILSLSIVSNFSYGQYCGAATTNVTITPTAVAQLSASYNSGRRAFNFVATAGCIYNFQTCGNSTADTYLRLYSTGTGGTLLASSDDNCGVQSTITWTCPANGTYSILMTNWSCAALTSATRLSYARLSCPSPCASNSVSFSVTAGSWPTEVSWTLVNSGGTTVASGGAPANQSLCLPTGCYTLNMFDSYGDGWNGATFSAVLGGTTIATGTLGSGSSGTAQIGVNTSCAPPPAPANDLVCNATAISCGATLAGTTINATNSGTGENGTCTTTQTMPGVWYVVPGNGQVMTASLCGTAWDSKIGIFSGANCSALTCIGGIDDFGPACASTSASYTWTSVVGVNYYILVHGYSSNSAFSLALSCVTPPPADLSSITASSSTICNGQSTTLTANGAVGTVYWFTGGCSTTGQIGTGNTLSVSPTTTTTYYARNFNAGQWSNNCASITITVNPNPVVNAGVDQTLCPGNVNLSGTVAPMSTTVFSENFGGTINWTTNDATRWLVNTSANAGGTAPEAMFQYLTGSAGTLLDASIFSQAINATGVTGLTLAFNHNVDWFVGTFALSAEVSLDNITWTPVWTLNPTNNVAATAVTGVNLSAMDNQSFYLRYRFNGDIWNIDYWYIDNIVITGNATPASSWTSSPSGFTSTSLTPSFTVPSTTTFTLSSTVNGCTASDNVLVTIQDLIAPTITAPSAVSVVADAGICTASGVALGSPTTADNCSVASVTNNALVVFPLGNTTVTWTVTDGSGNTTTATQIVTVTDNQNPSITAPSALTVVADPGICTASGVALGSPSTSDNCSVASTVNDGPATYPLGNTTVTWTVTDGSGNIATATQVITVTDNQNPTITAPSNVTVNADAGLCTATGVVLGTPVTADNCSVASTVNDGLTSYPLGSTTVTWTVTDGSSNTATATQTITVLDNQNPTIVAPSNVSVFADAGLCTASGVALGTPITADNCSVASTNNDGPTSYPLGTTTVTWTVTDGSGNTATSTQTVTVSDNQNPTITAPSNVVVSADPGVCSASGVNLGLPTTNDNCSVASVINDGPLVYPLGVTTVTWTVTDGSDNTSSSTQTVTVQDIENPNAICQNVTIQLDATGSASVSAAQVNNASNDNCGIASTVLSQTAFTCSNVGINPITMTVTDNSGNVSTCPSIITVQDIIAPTAICQNLNLSLDINGLLSITPSQVNNGSFDNCGIASLTLSETDFSCVDLGVNNLTLTVLDVNGNASTCASTLTIIDNNNPVFVSFPTNITETAVAGLCGRVVTYDIPLIDDNCGVAITQTDASGLTSGDIFPVGVTTQTYTVTDNSGNTISNSFTITITDNQLPVITNCPSNIVLNSSSNSCGAIANWVAPAISDNCPGVVVTATHTSGETFPIGVTTVTYTATDASSNVSTCSFTITVSDNVAPVVPTLATLTGACSVIVTAPTTTDNCSGSITGTTSSPLTYSAQGTYTIVWTFTDAAGNTSTANQTVIVLDNIAPTISAPAAVTVNANAACNASGVVLGSPTTSDNCSSVTTSNNAPAIFPLGTTTVIWTATDAAGNSATATQTVTVLDAQVPTISAPANITVQANASCVAYNVNIGNPITTDNCGVASVTNNGPAVYPLGTTTVTWTVSDNSGNTATATQTITVVDQALPIVVAPSNVTLFASNSCSILNSSFSLGSAYTSDNCTVANISNNAPAAFPVGTTTVVWTVTDGNGNTATANQLVTVFDLVNPTIVAPSTVTVNANASCAVTGVTLGTPITADNCSVLSVTNNAPATYPLGTTTVTWTVSDVNGNTATATQNVIVVDTQNPTIIAPSTVNATTNNSCMALNVNLGTPVTSDNCSIVSVTNNAPTAFNVGTTVVTWTVTDGSGNIATATQNVVITDVEDPIIVAPANITVSSTSGCIATGLSLGNATAFDNCTIANVTNNAPATFPVGTTTVVWTATDASGNTATANQLVTVEDNINPLITPPADISATTNTACTATGLNLGNPVTSDNCAVATVTNNAPFAFPVGITFVTWTVTDIHGNTSTAIQKVTIADVINPTLVVQPNIVVNANNSCSAFNVDLGAPTATDNCGIATLTNNAPTVYPLGLTTVTWIATDANGNSVSATQTVTVVDNTPPSIIAPASMNVSTTNNCVATGLILGTPIATDNCTVSSITNDAPIDFPVGSTIVTYTATDAAGNVSTATQTVTVSDDIDPTVVLQDLILTLNNQGEATFTFSDIDNGTTDNCGIASTTLSQSAFNCADIGVNTITVTVTDNNGNTTISTVTITVQSNGIDSDFDGIDDSCDGTPDPVNPIIPEAFTPNGNNINDLFVIGNIEAFTERRLDVFNRYGNSVYVSEKYENDWDGTRSDNSQALPDGTYYYVLTLNNGDIRKGFVYINRVKQ